MWYGHTMGGWGIAMMAIGMVAMLLFWGAVVALVVWAVRTVSGGKGAAERSPLGIARTRYARGEITKEQFQELRDELG
ncbi:MAG: SHOCT domain-containing protein [Dehalococcoidia bacterium]|nr:SHOCT domain-containing protein [Dehalococcoidia bacterium]